MKYLTMKVFKNVFNIKKSTRILWFYYANMFFPAGLHFLCSLFLITEWIRRNKIKIITDDNCHVVLGIPVRTSGRRRRRCVVIRIINGNTRNGVSDKLPDICYMRTETQTRRNAAEFWRSTLLPPPPSPLLIPVNGQVICT